MRDILFLPDGSVAQVGPDANREPRIGGSNVRPTSLTVHFGRMIRSQLSTVLMLVLSWLHIQDKSTIMSCTYSLGLWPDRVGLDTAPKYLVRLSVGFKVSGFLLTGGYNKRKQMI